MIKGIFAAIVLSAAIMFVLLGMLSFAAESSTPKAKEEISVNTALVGDVSSGEKVFKSICHVCHGENGDAGYKGGIKNAANFARPEVNPQRIKDVLSRLTRQDHMKIVKYGGTKSGVKGAGSGMPPYGQVLTDQKIADIVAYERATFPAFKNSPK